MIPELCHDATLKRNMVCLFLDDSKSWQQEKKQAGISPWMTIQISTPPKKCPPTKTIATLHPWKRTLLNPKNAGLESMIFRFKFNFRSIFWAANQRGISWWGQGYGSHGTTPFCLGYEEQPGPSLPCLKPTASLPLQNWPKLPPIAPKPGNQLSFNHWFSGVNLLSVSGRVRDS